MAEESENEGADADLKAQFLKALERKKGHNTDGVGGAGPDSSKVGDVHSKAGAKRQFRRKSGG
ncbi:MAG: DUF5302 domain-containing protein [Jatrophihabitans sp.]